MKYMDINSGEIWTEDEIRNGFESEPELWDSFNGDFDGYIDFLLDMGAQKIGGIIDVIDELYEAMRCDFGVMAEFGDDEDLLRQELEMADEEILAEYVKMFLS